MQDFMAGDKDLVFEEDEDLVMAEAEAGLEILKSQLAKCVENLVILHLNAGIDLINDSPVLVLVQAVCNQISGLMPIFLLEML